MTAAPIAVYPLHWEADVLLADGGVAHLRPSGPADTEAIRGLHGRSSAKNAVQGHDTSPLPVAGRQRQHGRHREPHLRRPFAGDADHVG